MKQIPLKNSKEVILVDDKDYDFLSKFIWKIIKKRGEYKHVYSTHFGKIVRPHRVILNINDPKIMIDHVNGNVLDNRRENLRICTSKENSRNIPKRKGKYTSKYKGVCWNKRMQQWTSRIVTDSGRLFLGYFDNEIDAAIAYKKAAIEFHKEFANYTEIENG